jgi:hypothetical protein
MIWFDAGTGTWEEIPAEINDQARTMTAGITRGGTYAVCLKAPPATVPPSTPVAPTTPVSVGFPWMIVIPVIVLIAVALAALVYFMSTRTYKGGPPPE